MIVGHHVVDPLAFIDDVGLVCLHGVQWFMRVLHLQEGVELVGEGPVDRVVARQEEGWSSSRAPCIHLHATGVEEAYEVGDVLVVRGLVLQALLSKGGSPEVLFTDELCELRQLFTDDLTEVLFTHALHGVAG